MSDKQVLCCASGAHTLAHVPHKTPGKQTGSTVAEMGYVFAARSIGYLVGSGIGGPLVDRLNGNVLLTGTLLFTGFFTALVPIITSVWLLSGAVASQVVQDLSLAFLTKPTPM